ncbi:MAG: 2-oxo acid dehydrogenase subunit E2 [Candidatus Melainabacteria bacterium]|nr:2-oxo acid dehydrogenase subunit E2 [Candidatus Melainabacteria bacterium]
MAVEFKLPDLGEGIHEAEIISLKVKEGDYVKEDDILMEVETDKAMVEIPSPYEGTVSKVHIEEGQTVTVGSVMFSFEQKGAKTAAKTVEKQAEAAVPAATRTAARAQTSAEPGSRAVTSSGSGNGNGQTAVHDRSRPVPAAPSVRRLARELNIDLHNVNGSGRGGRVLKEDVRAFATGALESSMSASHYQTEEPVSLKSKYGDSTAGGELAPLSSQAPELPDFTKFGEVERVPLRSIRRKIANNMMQSWTRIPHVTHFDEADVTALTYLIEEHDERFRQQNNGARLTITSLAVRAVVSALKKYPQFNASLDERTGEIIFKKYFNIGIAVATERGLIVPVIHNADRKSLPEIAMELKDIAEKTRAGKIELDRLQGGTFTITNIGAIGGTSMVPMINYPEAAILGMARAAEKPVVIDDEIDIGVILPLALSFDHRLADGAEAAYFVQHIVRLLSDPFHFVLEA